nr:MAG: nonstructural protein [Elaphodus cephalophus bocaparvovirus]
MSSQWRQRSRSRSPRETGSASRSACADGERSDRQRWRATRRWSPTQRRWIQPTGERGSGSSGAKGKSRSSFTASRACPTLTKKKTPYNIFSEHRAKSGTEEAFCGFYWHSTRIASKGTNDIFNGLKQEFQSRAVEGKCDWERVREILFVQKKHLDQYYRNMMYHFRFSECNKCTYWDDVYKKHLANVDTVSNSTEITDEEMLAAADAADQ